jgi:hypothetical protein
MDASSDPPFECCLWCKSTTFTIDEHGSFRCPNCDGPGTFSELWLDVKSGGPLSKALAGDHTLAALRNLVRVRLSMDFDGRALDLLVDWLVDHHGMTYEEVFVSKLTRIVEILRSENAPKSTEAPATDSESKAIANRQNQPPVSSARDEAGLGVDPVVLAIALISKHHGNRSAIAMELDIPRTSMQGKKWAQFNSRLAHFKKNGRVKG